MKRCIVFALLWALPLGAFAEETTEDFRLVEASGDVAVIPAGSDQALAASAGVPLSTGDRVVTGPGGTAELATREGTVIRLDSNSSLGLEDLRSGWTTFRLTVGRFLGKFQRTGKSRYTVKTPIAVASVRGTELALEVAEDGTLDAGVVEGEVAFESADDSEAGEITEAKEPWKEEVLTASQGLSVRPLERPRRLTEIPPPLVRSLDWFPKVRERVPRLRDAWKDLDPSARQRLRREALRERVQWRVPTHIRRNLQSPRDRTKPRPIERRRPLRTGPKRP